MGGRPKLRILIIILLFLSLQVLLCTKSPSDVDDDIDVDNTPPATITDLADTFVTTNSVLLQWTAPGDDDTVGFAYEYDLRVALDSITADNFTNGYRIDSVDAPLPPGYTQTFMVEGLTQGQEYFFAIKSGDDAGNWSGISNCVSATCLVDLVVTFPDTALERVIRETIDLPSGDIHVSDIQDITDLVGEQQGIENITGLEYCASLHWLLLAGNNITDISPLQTLTSLLTISLIGNSVNDITPLTNLSNLIQLHLGENPISDIQPLADMNNLEWLRLNSTQVRDFSPIYGLPNLLELDISSNELGDIAFISHFTQVRLLHLASNNITDISPVGELTQLESLNLFYNQISDISPLALLVNISDLNLAFNQISDILPLVNNAGLGQDDVVNLLNNPLSQQSIDEYIPILEQRGVTVYR